MHVPQQVRAAGGQRPPVARPQPSPLSVLCPCARRARATAGLCIPVLRLELSGQPAAHSPQPPPSPAAWPHSLPSPPPPLHPLSLPPPPLPGLPQRAAPQPAPLPLTPALHARLHPGGGGVPPLTRRGGPRLRRLPRQLRRPQPAARDSGAAPGRGRRRGGGAATGQRPAAGATPGAAGAAGEPRTLPRPPLPALPGRRGCSISPHGGRRPCLWGPSCPDHSADSRHAGGGADTGRQRRKQRARLTAAGVPRPHTAASARRPGRKSRHQPPAAAAQPATLS